MSEITSIAGATPRVPLPPGIRVEPQGRGEYRAVLLDIEGTTFELHPEDARLIGVALIKTAIDLEAE